MEKVRIGLEIHGYLNTREKLFCKCPAVHGLKHAKPNTNICPICTGQPGSKPMLPNSEAIKKIIQISILLRCKINKKLLWQRKHYNWPDLPKGYQDTISGAYSIPVGENGSFLGIKIREAHLEEDPAAWNPSTGEIDYNRSGSPLVEIVTEPEFKSPEEVKNWLRQLIHTLSYIKAIDKNSGLKIDVNISVGGERVEIKNINSIQNIGTALEYEIKRQKNSPVKKQETRMFDEKNARTVYMRSKEQTEDYRFISDPDLPLINIDKKQIDLIHSAIPELPHKKLQRMIKKYKINKKPAETLARNIDIAEFFEKVMQEIKNTKLAVPWVTGELLRVLNYNKKTLDEVRIDVRHFIELLHSIEKGIITEAKAKKILNKFIPESFSIRELSEEHKKISEKHEIEPLVDKAIKQNKKAVEDYKRGKPEALNFLIGRVMHLSAHRADYQKVRDILEKKLKS